MTQKNIIKEEKIIFTILVVIFLAVLFRTFDVYSANTIFDLTGNTILGTPTNNSITINMLAEKGVEAVINYGTISGSYDFKTDMNKSEQGEPVVIEINQLKSNTKYYYRVNYKRINDPDYITGTEYSFYTQRSSESVFSFGVQGDSHPERIGKMFNPDLYLLTMQNVAKFQPDFYFTMGDDFSIEKLISKNQVSQKSVDEVYLYQRLYLGLIGASSPLFLVNGNHEQAAKYLLDVTPNNPAILAAKARIKYYPLPIPNDFYTGDTEEVEHIIYRDIGVPVWINNYK